MDPCFEEWLERTFDDGGVDSFGDPLLRIKNGPIPYYCRTLNAEQTRRLIDRLERFTADSRCMCGAENVADFLHVTGCPAMMVGGEG